MEKAIPAFYACYLLRSTIRHASLYVGSTPHPVRRLKQHNGESKGGAVRTSRDSLRPWEMTCLVTGFPSQVAALQFEWAWQNTHLTRHVSPNSRLTPSKLAVRISPRTGRMRKRAGRPRQSLSDRLANLHLLLQSRSFSRWPLQLTFYADDVFRVWEKWSAHATTQLEARVQVRLSEPSRPPGQDSEVRLTAGTGIYTVDVGYQSMKPYLEKSKLILRESCSCAFCSKPLATEGDAILICPNGSCRSAGHLTCFASSFLRQDPDHLIPIHGQCPGCGSTVQWIDMVKELSLRMRTPKVVEKILKRKRPASTKSIQDDAVMIDEDEGSGEDVAVENDDNDDWHYLSDDDPNEDVENKAPTSDRSPGSKFPRTKNAILMSMADPTIEDSDWDDAELVT